MAYAGSDTAKELPSFVRAELQDQEAMKPLSMLFVCRGLCRKRVRTERRLMRENPTFAIEIVVRSKFRKDVDKCAPLHELTDGLRCYKSQR